MPKKPSTDRVRRWRAEQKDRGLVEIRGVWAFPEVHDRIKAYAERENRKIAKQRSDQEKKA